MRDGNWKLVEQYEDGSLELYDLAGDISETRNLAKEQPERAAAMQQQLAAWRRRVGAQENVPNPNFDAALHRQLYVDFDPSKIAATPTYEEIAEKTAAWRDAMNAAVKGSKARVTPATGDIRLLAKDARVHGATARYEPQPHKNTIGYWTRVEDWVSWDFDVPTAGRYEVEVQQGCKEGGSDVAVEVGGTTLKLTVVGTGHFQHFIQKTVGVVDLTAGKQTLAVKPQTKQGAAVMDLRRVVLRQLK
jgi:hypothetical protein